MSDISENDDPCKRSNVIQLAPYWFFKRYGYHPDDVWELVKKEASRPPTKIYLAGWLDYMRFNAECRKWNERRSKRHDAPLLAYCRHLIRQGRDDEAWLLGHARDVAEGAPDLTDGTVQFVSGRERKAQ